MSKYYEVVIEEVVGRSKTGREKKVKQPYLVDAQSVTEAESRVIQYYTKSQAMVEYHVVGAKESRIVDILV